MGVSTAKTVIITIFLILGMVLAGVLTQPKASLEAWNVNESDFPANASSEEKLTFLLRYAILAPSSYNTQPWRFNISGNEIDVFADRSRWLQVADADQRELYLSLGCCSGKFAWLRQTILATTAALHTSRARRILWPESYCSPGLSPSLDPRLFSAIASPPDKPQSL